MKKSHRLPVLSLILAAAVLTIGTAACGGTNVLKTSAEGVPSQPDAPAPTPTAQPEAKTSLEGRFTYSQMGSFVDTVNPMIKEFFAAEYPNLRAPQNVVYVPANQRASSACGTHDGTSYEYCPANDSIYVGQDLVWSFFRIGDAAPVIGLAHEWGHHLQSMKRLPSPRTAAESVAYENQADCIAGAWAQFADEKGWLEADDDLADVSGLMRSIGSRESRARDHGTVAERATAFQKGFDGGLKACNAYVPSAPIF